MIATLYNQYIVSYDPPFPPDNKEIKWDTIKIPLEIVSCDLSTGIYTVTIKKNSKYLDPADYGALPVDDTNHYWTLRDGDIIIMKEARETNELYDMAYIMEHEKYNTIIHVTENAEGNFTVELK